MLANLLLAALLGASQVHMSDGQVAVVTSEGLWLVTEGAPSPVVALAPAAAFGVPALDLPSVTHLAGTDAFVVTTRDTTGHGGLWRAHVGAGGSVTLDDLTPQIVMTPFPDLSDADFIRGPDELYLLDRSGGRILVLADPAHADGDALAVWRDLELEQPRSLAVDASSVPFSIVVAGRLTVERYDANGGVEVLYSGAAGKWHEVTTNPVTSMLYLLNTKDDVFGAPLDSGPVFPFLEFNAWGFCTHPVQAPLDFEWDPLEQGVLVLSDEGVLPCLFGTAALGANHVVRMPYLQSIPPTHVPALLTPANDSGIGGSGGDLALVRSAASEVTFFGEAGAAANGSSPHQFNDTVYGGAPKVGKPLVLSVHNAPADTAGLILFGAALQPAPLFGQTLYPRVDAMAVGQTDGTGAADKTLGVPNDPALAGQGVFVQWWFPDTTLPSATGWVGSQAAFLLVGP